MLQAIKKKITDSEGLLGSGGPSSRYAKLEQQVRKENDTFIDGQSQQQSMIMKEQDTQLDEVGETIGVLKQMGTVIHNELEEQEELLDDLDSEMSSTQDRLSRTLAKVDKALNISKDKKQSCCIVLLVLLLIILIIVYTG